MWFYGTWYGTHPDIGAPLYFINSGANGNGKNGVVQLYNNWRHYMDEGLSEKEIQARLTSQVRSIFPPGMLEIYDRYYAEEDRMLAIMGLIDHSTGVGNIPYVRVGTYQGRGAPSKTSVEIVRYTLVKPDSRQIILDT